MKNERIQKGLIRITLYKNDIIIGQHIETDILNERHWKFQQILAKAFNKETNLKFKKDSVTNQSILKQFTTKKDGKKPSMTQFN